MLGELSTNGNFSALLMHQLTKTWKVKLNAQVLGVKTTSYSVRSFCYDTLFLLFLGIFCGCPQTQESKWVGYQGTLDYQGSDFTASLTLANPNILDGSVVGVVQYLQAMTPK